MDLALQTSVLGVKTLHSTTEVSDNMTEASVLGMTVDVRVQVKH